MQLICGRNNKWILLVEWRSITSSVAQGTYSSPVTWHRHSGGRLFYGRRHGHQRQWVAVHAECGLHQQRLVVGVWHCAWSAWKNTSRRPYTACATCLSAEMLMLDSFSLSSGLCAGFSDCQVIISCNTWSTNHSTNKDTVYCIFVALLLLQARNNKQ